MSESRGLFSEVSDAPDRERSRKAARAQSAADACAGEAELCQESLTTKLCRLSTEQLSHRRAISRCRSIEGRSRSSACDPFRARCREAQRETTLLEQRSAEQKAPLQSPDSRTKADLLSRRV